MMIEQQNAQSPLAIDASDVAASPFPHVVSDRFLRPDLYERLCAEFPSDEIFDRNTSVGGRAGRDLYRGDRLHAEFLEQSPAWREFNDWLNSSAFIETVLRLFSPHMPSVGCRVDPAQGRFVDYIESRETLVDRSRVRRVMDRAMARFVSSSRTNDLFVRVDLAQGAKGYAKPVHCDRLNRLVSMLVYFCSADEIGLEGGELILHEPIDARPVQSLPRHPRPGETREVLRLRAQHNRGLLFLCSNNSYHSVSEVTAQRKYRNFVYISIATRGPRAW